MQQPSGKSCLSRIGSNLSVGKPVDKFHGSRGNADVQEIISAVETAGYGASLKSSNKSSNVVSSEDDSLADKETPKMKHRLFWSLGFLIVLMYISMGHMMWNFPIPSFLEEIMLPWESYSFCFPES